MQPQTHVANQPISSLSLPHATRTALADAGYKTTGEVLQITAADLSAELGLRISLAEDILKACTEGSGDGRLSEQAVELGGNGAYKGQVVAREGIDTHGGQMGAGAARIVPPAVKGTAPIDPLPPSRPSASQIQATTAASLLSTDALPRFSTCIDALDDLLAHFVPSSAPPPPFTQNGEPSGTQDPKGKRRAGNITPGMSVEIAGPPGIGKSCVALAMAVDARFMACRKRRRRSSQGGEVRGEGGEALIIDTEGGMPPDRIYNLAESVTRESSVSSQAMLDGIHLVRIATQVQMVAFINMLDEWLEQHPMVDLVIIDSLSYHFRQPSLDISHRRRVMDTVKQQIAKATTVHQCAVIVINQMANKSISADGKRTSFDTADKAVLMPVLGETWQTAKTIRIALFRGQPGNEIRYAHVGTSSDAEFGKWARFDIGAQGLPHDVDE